MSDLTPREAMAVAMLRADARRFHDAKVEEMAEIAHLLGAKMGTGQAQTAFLAANTPLNLGALTNLVAANVWVPGTYWVAGWATFTNASVVGAVDLGAVAGLAGTVLAPASIGASCSMTVTAASAQVASFAGVIQVTAVPVSNPGNLGIGPGTIQLQAFAAAGTTGVRANATTTVNGYLGATGLTVVQLDCWPIRPSTARPPSPCSTRTSGARRAGAPPPKTAPCSRVCCGTGRTRPPRTPPSSASPAKVSRCSWPCSSPGRGRRGRR